MGIVQSNKSFCNLFLSRTVLYTKGGRRREKVGRGIQRTFLR